MKTAKKEYGRTRRDRTTVRNQEASVRTTVSFSAVIWRSALRQMADRGFNDNLSAYLADLVRRADEAPRIQEIDKEVKDLQHRLAAAIQR